MIPNPIRKVLSTLSTNEVQYLLMGGQACVLYGAAEFSRDCDIAIVCDVQNLERFRTALDELNATSIAVPPFAVEYLQRGHALHFRCQSPEAAGIRIDVMAKLRGVAPFSDLWSRRTTLEDDTGARIELMSLVDLITAKKTQRDKDWPMLRRLIEANYAAHHKSPTGEQIRFWLEESRSTAMLIDLAARFPEVVADLKTQRPLLSQAIAANSNLLSEALEQEERVEREADRVYWEPLKRELEQMRREQRPPS